MSTSEAPYHAHIYYLPKERELAAAFRELLAEKMDTGEIAELLFIGELRDQKVGPHPIPQFEIHFTLAARPVILDLIEGSGLTSLVHPLTTDDLADHTSLGHWIGDPLELDLAPLDPPGMNQGIARFAKSDF